MMDTKQFRADHLHIFYSMRTLSFFYPINNKNDEYDLFNNVMRPVNADIFLILLSLLNRDAVTMWEHRIIVRTEHDG